jgi:hypothetical protein
MAWQARRVFFPAEAQRLALGVRSLPPGVAYYAVFRDDARAGWAQLEVDTLPSFSGFLVRDRVQLDLPSLGSAGRSERASEQYLDASLNLDSMILVSVLGADTVRTTAVSVGDSIVLLTDGRGRPTGTVAISEPVTTAAGWRLRLAAGDRAETGATYQAVVFDPLAGGARRQEIRVLETSSLAFPDSADTDSISGIWIPVREDTVRAWRVRTEAGDTALEGWIDEDGRLVDGQIFGGLRVERTAFELAFFTRPGAPVLGSQTESGVPEEQE